MNWLLISTHKRRPGYLGTNIGDEFACLGIERLIRDVDSNPEIIHFDKESKDHWDLSQAIAFDRLVICGMPLFWSTAEQTCLDIYWWDYLWNSALTHDPSRVLALGIGHVILNDSPHDPDRYDKAISEVRSKTFAVTTREPIHGAPSSWLDSICPSAWCLMGRHTKPIRHLCNLMLNGGHFAHLSNHAEQWNSFANEQLSPWLLDNGFEFVAHTENERQLATSLGWPSDRVHCFESASRYLDLYSEASCYIGNRMHGAAVCASIGVPTLAVTYDSRLGMVSRLGGMTTTPDDMSLDRVNRWMTGAEPSRPNPQFDPARQFDLCRKLMTSFAYPDREMLVTELARPYAGA